MGLLEALKKRSSAVRFNFSITIHELYPWPSNDEPVVVAWRRGSKRKNRGATKTAFPARVPGQIVAAVGFEHELQISATLYKESNASPTQRGPFKKKELLLAVMKTGIKKRSSETLGLVNLNLAKFAGTIREVKQDFAISGAGEKSVVDWIGSHLQLTIRCACKGAADPGVESQSSSERTTDSLTPISEHVPPSRGGDEIIMPSTGEHFVRIFGRLSTIQGSEIEVPDSLRRFSSAKLRSVQGSDGDRRLSEGPIRRSVSENVRFETVTYDLQEDSEAEAEDAKSNLTSELLKQHEAHTDQGTDAGASTSTSAGLGQREVFAVGGRRTAAWLSELDAQNEVGAPPSDDKDKAPHGWLQSTENIAEEALKLHDLDTENLSPFLYLS